MGCTIRGITRNRLFATPESGVWLNVWQEINGCRTNGCIAESGDFGIFWKFLDFSKFPTFSKIFQNPLFQGNGKFGNILEYFGKFSFLKQKINIPKSPDSAMRPFVLHPSTASRRTTARHRTHRHTNQGTKERPKE